MEAAAALSDTAVRAKPYQLLNLINFWKRTADQVQMVSSAFLDIAALTAAVEHTGKTPSPGSKKLVRYGKAQGILLEIERQ